MSAFDDAKSLVAHAQGELPKIKRAYDESLTSKTISPALLVEIKNFFENLRSALDFTAHGLFDRHCAKGGKKPKTYFPYATASQTREEFEKSGRIESCIPGLSAAKPDVVALILSVQHFAGDFAWLPTFMELNNENKHQRLVPQVRKETKELRITGDGASISLGQGASISIGQGASISVGGAIIQGAQSFDVNNPPRVHGGRVEVITWVSFHFEANDAPVLPLLEKALLGVEKIVAELGAKA